VAGRESDLAGLGLILLAVLFGLGTYGDVAGFVGHGLDWAAGAIVGLLRFAVPPGLLAIGVAIVAKRTSDQRFRLAVGYFGLTVALLGMMQVARGPVAGVPVAGVRRAGGIIGVASAVRCGPRWPVRARSSCWWPLPWPRCWSSPAPRSGRWPAGPRAPCRPA
jgi:hypothetical protein